jgi:ATP-binding cassette subfamily B protein
LSGVPGGGMPGGGMPGGGMPGMGGMGMPGMQPGMGAPMQDPSRPPGM